MDLPEIDIRTIAIGAVLGAVLIGGFLILTTSIGMRSGFYGVPPHATPWSQGYHTPVLAEPTPGGGH